MIKNITVKVFDKKPKNVKLGKWANVLDVLLLFDTGTDNLTILRNDIPVNQYNSLADGDTLVISKTYPDEE